jgi:hypothetical protein
MWCASTDADEGFDEETTNSFDEEFMDLDEERNFTIQWIHTANRNIDWITSIRSENLTRIRTIQRDMGYENTTCDMQKPKWHPKD